MKGERAKRRSRRGRVLKLESAKEPSLTLTRTWVTFRVTWKWFQEGALAPQECLESAGREQKRRGRVVVEREQAEA